MGFEPGPVHLTVLAVNSVDYNTAQQHLHRLRQFERVHYLVHYYAHTKQFCVVHETIKPKVLIVQTKLCMSFTVIASNFDSYHLVKQILLLPRPLSLL